MTELEKLASRPRELCRITDLPEREGSVALALSTPAVVLWEITTCCPHACAGCGNVFAHSGYSVATGDFARILGEIRKDVFDVRLTGGEPTAHPDFSVIVDLLESADLAYSVLSNGYWHKPEAVVNAVQGKKRFRGFLISLHGATAEDHDAFVRVPGSFDKVVKSIRYIADAGLYVSSNTILNRRTIMQIDEIADLAHSLGATYAVFNRYYGAHETYAIPLDALKTAAEKITADRRSGRMVRLGNCVPRCLARCDCDGCPAGNFSITIDPWLRVRPCNHAPVIVGDLTASRLKDIWHGEGMRRWRSYVPSTCNDCVYVEQCAAGCRAEGLLKGELADPAIRSGRQAFEDFDEPEVRLYRDQKLEVRCQSREETFGRLLFYEGEVILATDGTEDLLRDLDNGMTIRRVSEKYGADALGLVAELLLRGFVAYRN